VPTILDRIGNPDAVKAALSGLLIAALRSSSGEATFLVFLMNGLQENREDSLLIFVLFVFFVVKNRFSRTP
jgi:hypothetical protein